VPFICVTVNQNELVCSRKLTYTGEEKKVVDGRRKSEEGEGEGSPFAITI